MEVEFSFHIFINLNFFIMKKILLIGIIGLLTYSVNANAESLASTIEMGYMNQTKVCASEPDVLIRGGRVVIVYSDGTTVIVDNGTTTTIPPRP